MLDPSFLYRFFYRRLVSSCVTDLGTLTLKVRLTFTGWYKKSVTLKFLSVIFLPSTKMVLYSVIHLFIYFFKTISDRMSNSQHKDQESTSTAKEGQASVLEELRRKRRNAKRRLNRKKRKEEAAAAAAAAALALVSDSNDADSSSDRPTEERTKRSTHQEPACYKLTDDKRITYDYIYCTTCGANLCGEIVEDMITTSVSPAGSLGRLKAWCDCGNNTYHSSEVLPWIKGFLREHNNMDWWD